MSLFFDQEEADKVVYRILLRELRRRIPMSTILQDTEGNLLIVKEFEHASLEMAQALASKLSTELSTVQAWISKKEAETAPTETSTPEVAPAPVVDDPAPVAENPIAPPVPTDVEAASDPAPVASDTPVADATPAPEVAADPAVEQPPLQ
jgi:hypothetical protein